MWSPLESVTILCSSDYCIAPVLPAVIRFMSCSEREGEDRAEKERREGLSLLSWPRKKNHLNWFCPIRVIRPIRLEPISDFCDVWQTDDSHLSPGQDVSLSLETCKIGTHLHLGKVRKWRWTILPKDKTRSTDAGNQTLDPQIQSPALYWLRQPVPWTNNAKQQKYIKIFVYSFYYNLMSKRKIIESYA